MAVELTKRRVPAEYVTRSIVLGRGWTQGAIVRFLAEPDGTLANLRYRGSPPTRLYAMARVQAIEGTREWQEWFFVSRRRRAGVVADPGSVVGAGERSEPPVEPAGAVAGPLDGGVPGDGGGGDVVEGARAGGHAGGTRRDDAVVAVGAHVGAERDAGVGRGRDSKDSKSSRGSNGSQGSKGSKGEVA
ncbi:hypothetical protein ACFZBU_33985 [Embleya sp. NPDC008237]|uniref:hypothetical protein n=1 Tax=Embleya sp. NPDC008237 TaxID=3363978 RepID=UPI0036F09962